MCCQHLKISFKALRNEKMTICLILIWFELVQTVIISISLFQQCLFDCHFVLWLNYYDWLSSTYWIRATQNSILSGRVCFVQSFVIAKSLKWASVKPLESLWPVNFFWVPDQCTLLCKPFGVQTSFTHLVNQTSLGHFDSMWNVLSSSMFRVSRFGIFWGTMIWLKTGYVKSLRCSNITGTEIRVSFEDNITSNIWVIVG